MSLIIKCLKCNETFPAEKEILGQKTNCPHCNGKIQIPNKVETKKVNEKIDKTEQKGLLLLWIIILGIISIFLAFKTIGSIFVAIPAIILCYLLLSKINKSKGKLLGKRRARTSLVCCYISFIILFFNGSSENVKDKARNDYQTRNYNSRRYDKTINNYEKTAEQPGKFKSDTGRKALKISGQIGLQLLGALAQHKGYLPKPTTQKNVQSLNKYDAHQSGSESYKSSNPYQQNQYETQPKYNSNIEKTEYVNNNNIYNQNNVQSLNNNNGNQSFGTSYKPANNQNAQGNLQGTGKNFGEGYNRDLQGNLHGTGKNFGEGYNRDSQKNQSFGTSCKPANNFNNNQNANNSTAPLFGNGSKTIQGTGKEFGSGYIQDAQGNLQGTGKKFGEGYNRDSQGNMQGTGKNFGKGWNKDSQGNIQGTGKNFGSGYTQDAQGNLHGTGKNFGSGWNKDSQGNMQGTGKNFGKGYNSN